MDSKLMLKLNESVIERAKYFPMYCFCEAFADIDNT